MTPTTPECKLNTYKRKKQICKQFNLKNFKLERAMGHLFQPSIKEITPICMEQFLI